VGNYWKEADLETAVCRLRKVTACQGRPPLLVNAKTAVRRPPFLVDARWEKDEAGVRQPIEKKGARKLNTCVGKVRSVVGLQTHVKINLSFWVGTRPLLLKQNPLGDRQHDDRAKKLEKVAEDVVSFGSSCKVSVLFELGGVWGAFFVRGVSGGNSGGKLLGGTSGGWGLGSLRRTRGKGNYWKEVDPETAVCRLRNATARQGETAPPCGCRNGGLETAAPC